MFQVSLDDMQYLPATFPVTRKLYRRHRSNLSASGSDLILLPTTPPSPKSGQNLPKVLLTPDVAAPVDLSREGPFEVFCVPSDTVGHPLISEGLAA